MVEELDVAPFLHTVEQEPLAKRLRSETDRLQKALTYQKKRREAAEDHIKKLAGAKQHGRIQNIWFARVAMMQPTTSPQEFDHWSKSVGLDDEAAISRSRIDMCRGAVAEVVKQLNAQQIQAAVASLLSAAMESSREAASVVAVHVHDEAGMRLRSYVPAEDPTMNIGSAFKATLSRGRLSKIQNNVVTLSLADVPVPFFTELQALHKKDAGSIATAIIQVVERLFACIEKIDTGEAARRTVRFVHVLVGDAVGTNEAAAKRVMHHFQRRVRDSRGICIKYAMLLFKCATHQANLVCLVALCARLQPRAVDTHDLVGTCVRVFKSHFFYSEEMGWRGNVCGESSSW